MSRSLASSIFATVVSVCTATACSSKATPTVAPPVPVVAQAPPDAYVPGITIIGTVDPTGVHLDDDSPATAPVVRTAPRVARHLELLLRSSPPGALAAVDGVTVGATPILWEGEFTGREREFTFTLAGHRVARYRFVPLSNGVVHGRLEENELIPRPPGAGLAAPVSGPPVMRIKPAEVAPVAPVPPRLVEPPVTAPFVATPDASNGGSGNGNAIGPDASQAPATN